MFNNPINGKMQMVSVKMVGPGTSALPEEKLKLLTPEQIIEEPKREIEIIQKLHENGAGKHVIKLYDGYLK
jgi:hypothetical protein